MAQLLELYKARRFDQLQPAWFTTRTASLITGATATDQEIQLTLDFLLAYITIGTNVGAALNELEVSRMSIVEIGVEFLRGRNSIYASQLSANYRNFDRAPLLYEFRRNQVFLFDITNNHASAQVPSMTLEGYTLRTGTGAVAEATRTRIEAAQPAV